MLSSTKSNDFLIEVQNLRKWFPVRKGFASFLSKEGKKYVKAVDGVDLNIRKGEILALAGESGCGKTTTGRTILKLEKPDSGSITFEGTNITAVKKMKPYRKEMQMIFQNPYESFNPRSKIYDALKEPLRFHKMVNDHADVRKIVLRTLELVKLTPPEAYVNKYPSALSGGELQRISIARAMIVEPKFLVADEPVSMLDTSVRAGVLNFLKELRNRFGISILFITHDLSVASYTADRIGIMYLGKLVEEGSVESVVENPLHPYTQALIACVPHPDPTKKMRKVSLGGEPPNAINPPSGCSFHPRCPHSMEICSKEIPPSITVDRDHRVACFLYGPQEALQQAKPPGQQNH